MRTSSRFSDVAGSRGVSSLGTDAARQGGFRLKLLLSLLVAAVAACLYLPILRNQFVYDDVAQIVIDDYLHHPAHFLDVLSFRSMASGIIDNNRPVNVASLLLDATLWGANPVGFHLTNLLLHAACCWMLFWLACRLLTPTDSRPPPPDLPRPLLKIPWHLLAAGGAALMMAVHPINSETVSVASYREDLLVPVFLLAALLLAGHFPTSRRSTTLLLGVVIALSLLLAVGAKESGVGGPVLLALYWFAFRRRQSPRRPWLALLGASAVLVAAFVAARFLVVPKITEASPWLPPYLGGSFLNTLPLVPLIWVFQLRNALWPDALCADYTTRLVLSAGLDAVIIYFALALFLFLLVMLVRKSRAAVLAAGFFWLGILPVSSLAPMFRPIADRYMYLPMAGLSLLLGVALMFAGRHRLTRYAAPALVALALIPLTLISLRRQAVWHDSRSLWATTIATAPDSSTAADNLAFELYRSGDFRQAVSYWQRGVALTRGKSAEHLAGLAIGLEALGSHAEADRTYLAAAALDPAYADPPQLIRRHTWEQNFADKLQVLVDRNRGRGVNASGPSTRPRSSGAAPASE